MKSTLGFLAVLLLSAQLYAQAPTPQTVQPTVAAPQQDAPIDPKVYSALGAEIGKSLKLFNLSTSELDLVIAGLKDQIQNPKAEDLSALRPKIQELAQKKMKEAAELNKKAAEGFLSQEATKAGAQKKASGLIYTSIKEGTGAQPAAADTVKVHYRGTLVSGEEFDSSYKRNEPTEFPLNRVIPCWTEGVQLMKVGGKARLVCPSDIAYGDRGTPGIPPSSTLIFEVELIEVKAAPAPTPQAPTPSHP